MRVVRKMAKRLLRAWRRLMRRRSRRRIVYVTMGGMLLLSGLWVYNQTMPHAVDPAAYKPLLNTIAQGESNGNYNAYFGHAANADIRFTDMTVEQVLQWQEEYVHSGSPSSAVGRYQIIRPTLLGLVDELSLDRQEHFDAALQDRLAIALMERRGSVAYVNQKLTREQFAANLAKEWAALPSVIGPDPTASYYADDGLNKSRISIAAVYGALDRLSAADR
jgi:conjugal transfer mating pair stabilization protein TraG